MVSQIGFCGSGWLVSYDPVGGYGGVYVCEKLEIGALANGRRCAFEACLKRGHLEIGVNAS